MANRVLDPDELALADQLLREVRGKLEKLSGGDPELLFAFRRKVAKELTYDERSKPAARKKLKAQKRVEQKGRCALCKKALPESYNVLDRYVASAGYTKENTRLICQRCDTKTQASRGYK
jgi:ribosomal protein L44E